MMRLALVAVMFVIGSQTVSAQATSGVDVLRRMKDAYANKWYRTLTFTQKTTQYPPTGEPRVTTWYESLRYDEGRGVQLRIDIGEAKATSILYTADSTYVIRGGKLVRSDPHGNEFLPLIEGVYVQPLERTVRELRSMGFDLDKATSATWKGRPAWVVGTANASDSSAAQFWVDKERNVLVHALITPNPNAPPLSIDVDGYVKLAGGWLATKITMSAGGKPVQTEEYTDWKADIDVPASLFDPAQYPAGQP